MISLPRFRFISSRRIALNAVVVGSLADVLKLEVVC